MNRGESLSIGMIVIAAIGLLVLLVSVILVMKGAQNADKNTASNTCTVNGGRCVPNSWGNCPNVDDEVLQFSCSNSANGDTCCRYRF